MFFELDVRKLVVDAMAHFLRGPIFQAFVKVSAKELDTIHQDTLTIRDTALFDLSFTAQKNYLQELMNITFDPIGRGIFIENTIIFPDNFTFFDSEARPDTFVFFDSESKPPLTTRFQSEAQGDSDFIIFVPVALVFDEDEMRSLVNKYRAAGKTFEIETY